MQDNDEFLNDVFAGIEKAGAPNGAYIGSKGDNDRYANCLDGDFQLYLLVDHLIELGYAKKKEA